jgi:hypothetical protein
MHCSSPCLQGEVGGVKLLIFEAQSNPTPTLPCEQGREHNC